MKKILLLLLFTAFLITEMRAQGFDIFSNRNHPELNWQVAETEHFLIMYPDRIAGIESKAAAIAEESYEALSKNMGVEFSRKIRIYLSDEDEVNNGFAVPIGKGYTNIWVNLNDYSEIWTGREKWLRKVIAHELGHIFHFKAVWSSLGMLNYALANPVPPFWTEGIAQYQTESWDSQRGDRWLRKAIFDSRPGFRDGQSFENGRLMYAVGNSQLRYFTEKYGDSTLVDLLSHRNRFLFWDYHDFEKAFDEVVDGGYSAFYEEWRKHVNVYYNTVASQMERVDSLDAEQASFPGQSLVDLAVSPDGSQTAVLSRLSLSRPVMRLFTVQNDSTNKTVAVAEGGINADLSWSRDGKTIYFSRRVRGEYSSLVNDIHKLDLETGSETRITRSRRARYPAEGPGDKKISYIVNEDGTGNIFTLDLETGEETRVTSYSGDVQLLWLTWFPVEEQWLVHIFRENGDRHLTLIDPETGDETIIDHEEVDNRKMVVSPDGNQIAYTSLRDEVPNVFIYDFESGIERRFTNLFTGGEVYGWRAVDDSVQTEKLLIQASETKRRDYAHWVDVNREPFVTQVNVAENYASWRDKRPPVEISSHIEPDEGLITDRYRYRSFRNLTHAASFALPYYSTPDDWGIFATTNWTEPLGKHTIAALGWISVADPASGSYGAVNYFNKQFYPTLGFSFYRLPGNARFYGERFLIENLTGGEVTATWPIDRFEVPYQRSNWGLRLRHVLIDPIDQSAFSDLPQAPAPVSARQTDFRLGWSIKKQRPWRDNGFHPLDGTGLRIMATGAEEILGSDVQFITTDVNAYTILPAIGMHRVFLQGRFQAQWGDPLPQDYIGFSRYDNITIGLPNEVALQFFSDNERVRGYREFVSGKQVAFGSLEYRMPFLPSLQTNILGLIQLGGTSIALFSDAGVVWDALRADGSRDTETRWGAGAEIKNRVQLFGINFTHSLGIAQPAEKLFTDADTDIYYRVRTIIPF